MAEKLKLGWLKDYADHRDFCIDSKTIGKEIELIVPYKKDKYYRYRLNQNDIPDALDLRQYCSEIEKQELGDCTAHAAAGLLEFYMRKNFGRYIDVSRRFIYKTTRDRLGFTGDTGAFIRSTMGAIRLYGVPPEAQFPYNSSRFDEEPSARIYAEAQGFCRPYGHYRLDIAGRDKSYVLFLMKSLLNAGIPSMFGFTVTQSIYFPEGKGDIPYPLNTDGVIGGHAVDCIGYDDNYVVRDSRKTPNECKGAFIIRNSWGKDWGEAGYG